MLKRIAPWAFVLAILAAAAGIIFTRARDPFESLPNVTINRIVQGETDWYAAGILDYRLLAEVRFGLEQRRYEVFVVGGLLDRATSSRREASGREWTTPAPILAQEAEFFTIAGLFGLLRSDLQNQEVDREFMRMGLDPEFHFPSAILLGNIIQGGFPVQDTELRIEVLEFEPGQAP